MCKELSNFFRHVTQVVLVAFLFVAIPFSSVTGADRALVVTGIAGDKKHHETFQSLGQGMKQALKQKFYYGDRVDWLAEIPDQAKSADGQSSDTGLDQWMAEASDRADTTDELLVFLIGHANGDNNQWRLNLPGPDYTARDWKEWIKAYPGTVSLVVSAPYSRELVPVVSGEDRIIITSSRTREKNHWMFRRGLKRLILGTTLRENESKPSFPTIQPTDSLFTFFRTMGELMKQYRNQKKYMHDQHPGLDDNGDGVATEFESLKGNLSQGLDGNRASDIRIGNLEGDTNFEDTSKDTVSVSSEITKLAKQSYPDTQDAVVLLREINGDLDNDQSSQWNHHIAIKILNESGRRFADFDRRFYPWMEVTIERARTILPSGRTIPVDTHAIQKKSGDSDDTTPQDPSRFRLNFSKPKPGAILELEYTVSTQRYSLENNFSHELRLQGEIPIRRARVNFSYPESINMNIVPWFPPALDSDTHLVREKKPYTKTLRFTANNLPPVESEPVSDPLRLRMGKIVFSSVKSWDRIARWYQYYSRASRQASPAVKKLAKRLTNPDSGRMEKIKTLYEWTAEEIRYVSIPLGVHGYKPRMVPDILKWKYGDCKAKASLLMTLLDQVGIQSQMVLIGAGMGDIIPKAPRKTAFNHAIVAIPKKGGGVRFLDPTSENSMFGTLPPMDQGREALVIWGDTGSLVQVPYDTPKENRLKIRRKIDVEGVDLVVKETRTSRGRPAFSRRRLIRNKGASNARSTIKSTYNQRYGNVSDLSYEVEQLKDINKPLIETISYRINRGARGALTLPWAHSPLRKVSPDDHRMSYVSIGSTVKINEINKVEGYTTRSHHSEESNAFGHASFDVNTNGASITAKRMLTIERARAPASMYPDLVKLASVSPHPLPPKSGGASPSLLTNNLWIIAGGGVILLIAGAGLGWGMSRLSS
ncbi:MAG: DUF3857 domain-containing transglutaminase family protein [bacterium]